MWITCVLLQCFYQLFGLSYWRHPFTAEDPLVSKWYNAEFFQICSDEQTNWSASWTARGQIFIFGWTILLNNKTIHWTHCTSFRSKIKSAAALTKVCWRRSTKSLPVVLLKRRLLVGHCGAPLLCIFPIKTLLEGLVSVTFLTKLLTVPSGRLYPRHWNKTLR